MVNAAAHEADFPGRCEVLLDAQREQAHHIPFQGVMREAAAAADPFSVSATTDLCCCQTKYRQIIGFPYQHEPNKSLNFRLHH
jgi:hypothetical protein